MMINYLFVVNTRGELRLAKYYKHFTSEERKQLQTEVIKLCLTRGQNQSSILDYEDYTIVFQRFNTVVFIAGITQDENELAILTLFRHISETLHKYLGSLTEIHFVFNLEKVHMVLDEMIMNGYIAETSQARILAPLQLMTSSKK